MSSDRYAKLLLRNQLSLPLRELQIAWNANREVIQEALRQVTSSEVDAEVKLVAMESVNSWLKGVEDKLSASQQVASTILPQVDSYLDQVDLELLNKGLDQLKSNYVPRLRESLTNLTKPSGINGGIPSDSASESRESALQRTEELLVSGGELTTQMRDFQQELIGLALQSGLTKDAMYLRKIQTDAIAQSGEQLANLARSQLITTKITESVLDIVRSTRSDVPKGLAERLEEWSRWVNDARSQILDILEQLESNSDPSIGDELKRRIATDAEEWKYRSWLFHLDGGLFWSAQSRRKDVDFRTENIDNSLNRMIELSEQLRRLETNKELSSSAFAFIRSELLKERDLYSLVLMNQIQARRELHQSRSIQNQDYPADLGLTKRALDFLLDPNRSPTIRNANGSDLVRDLRTVLQSYRVLDAAHQAADAKLGVERLTEAERYDFSSLRSQLDHNLQWSAVSQQLEVAHRKMQRAIFPDGLHDQYNGLRWRSAFAEANQKFSLRMDPSSTLSVSATPELEELLKTWSTLDLKAQTFVEEARNALRRLVPSIPELAAEAVAKNKELESKTRELTKSSDGESPTEKTRADEIKELSDTEEPFQSLSKSEQALESATERLREALADEAARQNLLDSDSRKQARDSDAALGMIERARTDLEQAMQALKNEDSLTQKGVADALKAEKRMETTLQAIRERFNQENNVAKQEPLFDSISAAQQQESSLTNGSIDPAESQTANESEMDAGYQRAEQLDALSQRNKEELLRDLEQQLKSDAIMREELQTISETQRQSLANELQALSKSE